MFSTFAFAIDIKTACARSALRVRKWSEYERHMPLNLAESLTTGFPYKGMTLRGPDVIIAPLRVVLGNKIRHDGKSLFRTNLEISNKVTNNRIFHMQEISKCSDGESRLSTSDGHSC